MRVNAIKCTSSLLMSGLCARGELCGVTHHRLRDHEPAGYGCENPTVLLI